MGNLYDACQQIGALLGLDPADLRIEADMDQIGGYHADITQRRFDTGSIWGVEGQILYALIRVIRPRKVIEVGTYHGCSTLHMATALQDNHDQYGDKVELITIDNGFLPGANQVKLDFPFVRMIQGDAIEVLQSHKGTFDFLFEDGRHDTEFVSAVYRAAKPLASSGAVIVSHDAAHYMVGEAIKQGIIEAGFSPLVVNPEPSDCGLAISFWGDDMTFDYHDEDTTQMPAFNEDDIDTSLTARMENDPKAMTKAELEGELEARGIDPNSITGSGANGALLKADLVSAVIEARRG